MEVQALDNVDILPPYRQTLHAYGGTNFLVNAASLAAEVAIALSFAWRPMAVLQGMLVPLWMEAAIVPHPVVMSTQRIDASLAAQANFSRKQLNAVFQESSTLTGEEVAALLKKTRHQYDSIDSEFEADASLILSLGGKNSEIRLVDRMLTLFPTLTTSIEVESVLHSVVSIVNENVYKLASKPGQANHTAVKNMLCMLVDGKEPDLHLIASDPNLKRIVNQLQFFVRHETAASSTGAGVTTTGYAALQKQLAVLQASIAADVTYVSTAKDVVDFTTYKFLIPEADLLPFTVAIATHKIDGVARIGRGRAKAKTKLTKNRALSEAMAMFG
jgi:hypothetical protein